MFVIAIPRLHRPLDHCVVVSALGGGVFIRMGRFEQLLLAMGKCRRVSLLLPLDVVLVVESWAILRGRLEVAARFEVRLTW